MSAPRATCATDAVAASRSPMPVAKLTQSRRLWTDAQARFEAAYGAERAVALRRALAEIFSEDFALAFSRG